MEWTGLLPTICAKYQVDPILVKSICMVESSGVSFKTRFEPDWHYFSQTLFWSNKLGITNETEKKMQAMSWGLGQVMGAVARELGFSGYLPQLCQPEIGLEYCAKKLSQLSLKYKDQKEVIVSYNAGSPVMDISTGLYKNQHYLVRVSEYYRTFKGIK